MGRDVRGNGFSTIRTFGLLAVIGAGMVLGGCSRVPKKDYELAKQESSDLRTENAQLEQQNRDLATRVTQLEATQAQIAAQQQQVQQPQPQQWTGGDNGGSRRGGDGDGFVMAELAGDVTFGSGSAELTPAARKKLDSIASDLKRNYANADVRVEGYTDKHQPKKMVKKYPTNEALSQARAESVERYLISRGVSSSRISAVGYGSAKLRSTDSASRRVEIRILN
jgi:outer membrane protein OmpA-like peptidoglycan-associated protein